MGLQDAYKQDEELAIRLRMLPAPAFASPFDVPNIFPQVIAQLNIPESADISLYFENTYISRTLTGGTQVAPLLQLRIGIDHIMSRLVVITQIYGNLLVHSKGAVFGVEVSMPSL